MTLLHRTILYGGFILFLIVFFVTLGRISVIVKREDQRLQDAHDREEKPFIDACNAVGGYVIRYPQNAKIADCKVIGR